jgi:hypothetical protein
MMNRYNIGLVWIVIPLLSIWAVYAVAGPVKNTPVCQNQKEQNTLKINSDGTALVVGVVAENYLGCVRDISCYLRLGVSGDEVRIIYNGGEGEGCVNQKNADKGIAIKPGTVISALGRYVRKSQLHLINVCASSNYYLGKGARPAKPCHST